MRYLDAQRIGDRLHVMRTFIDDAGNERHQEIMMPHDTPSIRAGEYGLHPVDDADDVWDMILHEPLIVETSALPLIVTAPTLQEARDQHLARCRATRDEHYQRTAKAVRYRVARPEQERHVDVLESLKTLGTADPQLAELSREHMKHAVRAERLRQTAPTISRKARLIDEIREREGI